MKLILMKHQQVKQIKLTISFLNTAIQIHCHMLLHLKFGDLPHSKVQAMKRSNRGWHKGKSHIVTDTPEKLIIEDGMREKKKQHPKCNK